MALRVAEIESLFTANLDQIERAEKTIKQAGERVEKNPIKLDADVKGALGGMDRVETQAKKLVSERAVLKLDADVTRAEKSLERAIDKLEDLHIRAEGGLDVTADVKRAEASISRVERQLDGLRKARTVVEVEADTSQLDDAVEDSGDAGEESGKAFGKNIIAALVAIPIVGAVVGIAAAAGKALVDEFQDALQIDVGYDRLQALTGIDEDDALRLGRAAGEAYANNFGESIESNMDTSRLALQFGILDEKATTRDAQKVVQGLAGISAVLDEDVARSAQAVTTLLSTGMAKSAEDAYDIIAAGAREGVDRGEDMLDTLIEYPAVLKRLGLSGDEMLGLLNQGLKAGARNSDFAADALKEFQIRATDGSKASAAGFERIGLSAEDMTAKVASGGEAAKEGLAQVLDALRDMEDPVQRNAAAVELFGTKAEDLGEALFAMDLSTAVEQLDGVTGSAQRMFDTLADNDASKLEQAKRNIEVATDGIKGALAAAFSEPIGDFGDWVSENRGPLMQFFLDLANGALDFAVSATEGVGAFVSGPLAEMVDGLAVAIKFFNWGADTSELDALAEGMRGFESTTDDAVGAIEAARSKLNEFGEPIVQLGLVNDAALRTANSIDRVGFAAESGAVLLSELTFAQDGTVKASGELKDQLDASAESLRGEYDAAIAAGESQENLKARYDSTSEALVAQLTAMGLTEDQARTLIDTVLQTPADASTEFSSNAESETEKIENLTNRIVTLPDGETTIKAVTEDATARLQALKDQLESIPGYRSVTLETITMGNRTVSAQANGSIVEFMANGGLRGLTPMSQIAQTVPANTWRVVGDRSDVPEVYAPLDGSARSWSILMEGMRRMPGVMPMAEGTVAMPTASSGGRGAGGQIFQFGDIIVDGTGLSPAELQTAIGQGVRAEINRVFAMGGL